MTTEKPILFNAEMVRAILDGRKTQTRRVVKPQPDKNHPCSWDLYEDVESPWPLCPHGKIGDELWVRETWCPHEDYDNVKPSEIKNCTRVCYRADKEWDFSRWRPSIFMPRWASRIQLRIANVRVERVQDISEGDALAEGIRLIDVATRGFRDSRFAFEVLWNSINAKRGHSWESNPYVWVIEFEMVKL